MVEWGWQWPLEEFSCFAVRMSLTVASHALLSFLSGLYAGQHEGCPYVIAYGHFSFTFMLSHSASACKTLGKKGSSSSHDSKIGGRKIGNINLESCSQNLGFGNSWQMCQTEPTRMHYSFPLKKKKYLSTFTHISIKDYQNKSNLFAK